MSADFESGESPTGGALPTPPAPIVIKPVNPASRGPNIALIVAIGGWLLMGYGWYAELDTGHPGGLVCTDHPPTSVDYASCMKGAEETGAIAWSVTLGLAMLGVAILVQMWRGRLQGGAAWPLVVAASVLSFGLAVTATIVAVSGAQGEIYEGRASSATWILVNVVAALVGVVAGGLIARRLRSP